jgi:hypothetical protein
MSADAIGGVAGQKLGTLAAGTFGWSAATWGQIGWTAGVLAANYLFAPDGPDIVNEGPRLDDLNVTSSAYGVDIPKVFGSYRISGNIIWAMPIQETRHEQRSEEGKGGGGSETNIYYTYSGSFAVALCEGEASSIGKIWFNSKLVYDNGTVLEPLTQDNFEIYLGTDDQVVDWFIEADKPDTPAYRNIVYIVFRNLPLGLTGNALPNVTAEVIKTPNTIGSIISELCIASGLTANDIDVTNGTDTITGYVISRNITARGAIDPLLSTYEYVLVENNHTLQLRKMNQTPVLTINEIHYGADSENKIEYNQKQDLELYKKLTVRYANKNSDYEISSQSVLRTDVYANEEKIIDLPLAITDNQAKQLCEKNLYRSWLNRFSYSFDIPFEYYYQLVAGDVITINQDNIQRDIRLTKLNFVETGVLKCYGVLEDAEAYLSDSIGEDTGGNQGIISISDSQLLILDIPTLLNVNLYDELMYCSANGTTANWHGCAVYSKPTAPDTYILQDTLSGNTIQGVSTTTLASGPTHVWDRANTVTVDINYGSLYSVSESQVLNGLNYCVLGNEIIQYANATDNGDGTFTLDTLLRGRRGTESFVGTHTSSDRFVLLNLLTMGITNQVVNSNYYYGSLSIGKSSDNTVDHGQTLYTGKNLKPFSPAYFKGQRDGTDINLQWMRRSRYISGYLNILPISEDVEKYTLEVYNDLDVLQETVNNILSTSYTYDTTTHFGPTDEVRFKVYQVSGLVGNGYPSDYLKVE